MSKNVCVLLYYTGNTNALHDNDYSYSIGRIIDSVSFIREFM